MKYQAEGSTIYESCKFAEEVRKSIQERHVRIQNKSDLREWLRVEQKKYGIRNRIAALVMAVLMVSEKCIIWRIQRRLRITEYHMNTGHSLRYKLSIGLYHRMAFRWGIRIPPNTCGEGLVIPHVGSILIDKDARIGQNAVFHINTSITAGPDNRSAVVGDDVYFFVGRLF